MPTNDNRNYALVINDTFEIIDLELVFSKQLETTLSWYLQMLLYAVKSFARNISVIDLERIMEISWFLWHYISPDLIKT